MAVTVPAVAEKLAVVAPAATVTEAGTAKAAPLLSERLTTVPPVEAGMETVTVQEVAAPEFRLLELHCSAETAGSTLIKPPAPETGTLVPSANAPIVLLIGRESRLLLLAGERVAETTATTPLPMALAFMPVARQVTEPAAELQLSVLPAAVNAGPAAVLSEIMALGGYESVHSRPAGALVAALKERFSDREPPCTAEPEAKLKDGP